MNYLLVLVGGGIGSLLRYSTSQGVNALFSQKFTLGTFAVNCAGSLLIGFLVALFDLLSVDSRWRLLAITGFLGGYTTYSAYAYETVHYIIEGNVKYAVLNILMHNVACLLLVVAGIWLNKLIFTR